jgi:CO dehydrogenase/acetyl-CoA synthase epsilon subunit
MRYKGILESNFASLIEDKSVKQIEADIIDFVIFLKDRGYTQGSQKAYLNSLMHFYSINDIALERRYQSFCQTMTRIRMKKNMETRPIPVNKYLEY